MPQSPQPRPPPQPREQQRGQPAHFFNYSFHYGDLHSSHFHFFTLLKITSLPARPQLPKTTSWRQSGRDQLLRNEAFGSCSRAKEHNPSWSARLPDPAPGAGGGRHGVQSWRLSQTQANALPGGRLPSLLCLQIRFLWSVSKLFFKCAGKEGATRPPRFPGSRESRVGELGHAEEAKANGKGPYWEQRVPPYLKRNWVFSSPLPWSWGGRKLERERETEPERQTDRRTDRQTERMRMRDEERERDWLQQPSKQRAKGWWKPERSVRSSGGTARSRRRRRRP